MPYIKFRNKERLVIDRGAHYSTFTMLLNKGFLYDELQIEGRDVVSMYMPNIIKWSAKKRDIYKYKYPDIA